MPERLVAVALTSDKVAQVLPLARSLMPALELDAWTDFAREQLDGAPLRGIVGVRDERGYFHGMFGYQVRGDLHDGTVLDVQWATAIDLLNRAGAVGVLIRELEGLAARLRCAKVQVRLQPEQRRLRRLLEGEGFVLRSVAFEKPVAQD